MTFETDKLLQYINSMYVYLCCADKYILTDCANLARESTTAFQRMS